jgi:hypothetical protein
MSLFFSPYALITSTIVIAFDPLLQMYLQGQVDQIVIYKHHGIMAYTISVFGYNQMSLKIDEEKNEFLRNTLQHRHLGEEHIICEYFCEISIYDDQQFCRCYRMKRSLFFQIVIAMNEGDSYFVQQQNACNAMGLSALQNAIQLFQC